MQNIECNFSVLTAVVTLFFLFKLSKVTLVYVQISDAAELGVMALIICHV